MKKEKAMEEDRTALRMIEKITRIARTTAIDNPELMAYMNAIEVIVGEAFGRYNIIDDDD